MQDPDVLFSSECHRPNSPAKIKNVPIVPVPRAVRLAPITHSPKDVVLLFIFLSPLLFGV
jgi:hypothetical protein